MRNYEIFIILRMRDTPGEELRQPTSKFPWGNHPPRWKIIYRSDTEKTILAKFISMCD